MTRKHMGLFDEVFLARVDAYAERETGGNRRLWIQRVVEWTMDNAEASGRTVLQEIAHHQEG